MNPPTTYSLRRNIIPSIISALLGAAIFGVILIGGIGTDIQSHTYILTQYIDRGLVPIPPLYFLTIFTFGGFSVDPNTLLIASGVVLTASIAFKFVATGILSSGITGSIPKITFGRLGIPASAFMIALLFAHPLAWQGLEHIYLGKVATSVWHNSTTIFLTPFALLLFHYANRYLSTYSKRDLLYIVLFSVINILIKPSFFFVMVVSFPAVILITSNFKWRREYAQVAGALAVCCIILATEYFYLYKLNVLDQVYYQGKESKIVIAPFVVWNMYSNSKILDLVASLAFPLVLTLAYRGKIYRNRTFWFAALTFLVGMLFLILLAEEGPRLHHFNFIWQAIVSNYVFFAVCTAVWTRILSSIPDRRPVDYLVLGVFLAHVASGLLYLYKVLVIKTYL